MNNLHRELAPISQGAWTQIEEEASRTLKRFLAARRVVDVTGPEGMQLAAIGTGHSRPIETLCDGLDVRQRIVTPVVELKAPFSLTRAAIDDVERGSKDSDWQPLKDAARRIAFAEDRIVFEGYEAGGIKGMRQLSDHQPLTFPADFDGYPNVVSRAVNSLKLAGVNGPYALLLGAKAFEGISGGSEEGYPLLKHMQQLVDQEVVWSPGITGGIVTTARGGDFELTLGQDLSIGYTKHDEDRVELYLQESLTFQALTSEACVIIGAAKETAAS